MNDAQASNPFADDWRECLRAHYSHVIRTNDRVTLPSLTYVMKQAGFDESELAELRVRATIRTDDMPADFVPDLNALEPPAPEEPRVFPAAAADAADAAEPDQLADRVEELDPDEAALLYGEEFEDQLDLPEAESEELPDSELPAEDDPDDPQQLSLF